MKIIITERQQKLISEDEDRGFLIKKKIAKNELTKKYGDLIRFTYDDWDDLIFYKNKYGKIIFEYNEEYGHVYVDYETIWKFLEDIFQLESFNIQKIIEDWISENYNLDVSGATFTHSGGYVNWYYVPKEM